MIAHRPLSLHMPRWLLGLGIISAALIAFLAARHLYLHDPADSSLFPACLFHSLTGFSCPGCGLQRAAHDLLHGRLWSAFCHNPLLFLAAGLLSFHAGSRRLPALRRWSPLARIHAGRAMLAIVLAFWIGRNLLSS